MSMPTFLSVTLLESQPVQHSIKSLSMVPMAPKFSENNTNNVTSQKFIEH